MRIGIWGSCVTRDALEVRENRFDEISYFARSSWVAQASPPPNLELADDPEMAARFGERMVTEDLGRAIVGGLLSAAPDVVVIDLIDERFDLLDTGGGAWVTESDYLIRRTSEAAREGSTAA